MAPHICERGSQTIGRVSAMICVTKGFLPRFVCFLLMTVLMPVATPTSLVEADVDPPAAVWVDDDFDDSTPGWGTDHFRTIQEGIDAVAPKGTVHVAEGIYRGIGNGDLELRGKAITVKSIDGPEHCVIDCEKAGRGFHVNQGEGSDTLVSGFTITNGEASEGGGILCSDSAPAIEDCVIKDNTAVTGGGMMLTSSNAIITNCTILRNTADARGGGIYLCDESSPTITNCSIAGNSALGEGGSICCSASCSPLIINCNIALNTANKGGGLYCRNASPTVINCTFAGNDATGGGGTCCEEGT
jgi:parallel beta-helix repeat protein